MPTHARAHLLFLLLAACFEACFAAHAQDGAGGVVTSQTVSVAGHDFYQSFTAAWREKEGSDAYPIAVRERPSARWGGEVQIEFAHRIVFRARLPAARAAVAALGAEAAETALQAVLAADVQRKLSRDIDLAPDEF